MNKLILTIALISVSAMVNASYLYWQVTPGEYTEETWDKASLYIISGDNATYADFVGQSAKQNVGSVADNTYTTLNNSPTKVTADSSVGYVADIGTLGSGQYSFFVELWNSSTSTRVGFSDIQTISGSSTPSYVYADTGALTAAMSPANIASAMPWHATSYGPVPEPTSAILMLFGAAFLGLKRKNRSIV